MKSHTRLTTALAAVLGTGLALAVGPAAASYPKDSLPTEYAIGASPAPPMGAGPGRLSEWRVGGKAVRHGRFGQPGTASGNSFYIGYDRDSRTLFVPTEAGETYVLDRASMETLGKFPSIRGGRLARVTPDDGTVVVLSGGRVAAYSSTDWRPLFEDDVGGNAMAISADSRHLFVGGNRDRTITEIALPSGHIERHFPVADAGDMVWANHKLFSANMGTGVMSVVYPNSGKIVAIVTPEVDPHFSYHHIPQAKAGFMQLAVSPGQRAVYAAGFSGHILMFSTHQDSYLGEIPVRLGGQGPEKLSGLTLVDGGADALVTVENRKETALVNLVKGKVLRTFPGVVSNRWITVTPPPVG
jgi:hypothetical protein